jgi:pSer/pThr/pTyr-binding forkhead associated (FHA) protein
MVALRPLVSRWHAAVYYNGQRCAVVDLGSTHGTVLNGQRLPPQKPFPLQVGDQLALAGQLYFKVQESDQADISTGIPTGPPAVRRRRRTSLGQPVRPFVVALAALALILLVALLLLAVLYVRGGA